MSDPLTIVVSPADFPRIGDSALIDAGCGCRAWIEPGSLGLLLDRTVATRTVCVRHIGDVELRDGATP